MIPIEMHSADFNDAVIFRTAIGTTGYQGGDGGHGGRTVLVLENPHRTDDIKFAISNRRSVLTMTLRGDAELRNLKRALRWLLKRLEDATGADEGDSDVNVQNVRTSSTEVH